MKRNVLTTAALLLTAAFSLTSCASDGWGDKQTAGTVIGAGGGALLGNQFGKGTGNVVMTALGAVAGAWLGNEIGASLDSADQAKLDHAQRRAYEAPVGQTITWNNPQSGHYGTFTPTRDGTSASGEYCREFNQTVVIGGQRQQAYGTACRQPDGAWRMVNS
jgi:surface antigen